MEYLKRYFPTLQAWLSGAKIPLRSTATQQQSLIRVLAVAVETRMSLPQIVSALAEDEYGGQRIRLMHLAKALRNGVNLADAMEQVPHVASEEAVLAVRLGSQSGTLAATLEALVQSGRASERTTAHDVFNAVVYIAVLLAIVLVVNLHFYYEVLPALSSIVQDLEAGNASIMNIYRQMVPVNYWYLFVLIALFAVWFLRSGRAARSLRRGVLSRVVRPWVDMRSADVLQNLSLVSKAGRPLPGAIGTLARYHYDPVVRNKLLFVRNEMELGGDIWDAFQQVALINRSEARALHSAEKVGNDGWIIQQLANSRRARVRSRLCTAAELVRPVLVGIVALMILLFALTVFIPMTRLLIELA